MDGNAGIDIGEKLYPNERVLWRGRPGRLFILRGRDLSALVGAIFSLLFIPLALSQVGPMIVAVPMMGILFFNVGRVPYAAWLRSRTDYVVTSERVLILTEGFSRSVKSMPLLTLADISSSVRPDGRGTIAFEGNGAGALARRFGSRGEVAPKPSFEMIPDARGVYDLIIEARRQA